MRKISSANMGFGRANIQGLHGSTTDDCTAVVSTHGYRRLMTVERGRINGGKLILSLMCFLPLYIFTVFLLYFVS